MNASELKVAVARIMKGEKATLVVSQENAAQARQIHASLSPRLVIRTHQGPAKVEPTTGLCLECYARVAGWTPTQLYPEWSRLGTTISTCKNA